MQTNTKDKEDKSDNKEKKKEKEETKIEHLVLSGGGIIGLVEYGALRESNRVGLWKKEDLKSVYATSIGSVIAVMITLGYDWETLDDFIIKRPWHHLFPVELNTLLLGMQNRGIFTRQHFDPIFTPIFLGKDLPIDITLQGYYEWTGGIELHIFATDINQDYSVDVDFSRRTHPETKLLDAIYCSCSLPGVFSPMMTDGGPCYLDGGIFKNYPAKDCIEGQLCNPASVLGFRRCVQHVIGELCATSQSTLLDTVLIFCSKITERMSTIPSLHIKVPCEIVLKSRPMSLMKLYEVMSKSEERMRLIEEGVQFASNFANSVCTSIDNDSGNTI